jgi:4'-phosphopantetheinyl transferase
MTEQKNIITEKLVLSKNEIHLWTVKPQDFFQGPGSDLLKQRYQSLLTDDETIKQQRYKFEKDKHDALITRAFIRDLLSYYAEVAPSDWRFDKGEKDKPEIVNPPLPLRFNLSHTKNLIICAVTLSDDIGCDVENTTRSNDVLAVADRYFSPSETQELFSKPLEQQHQLFFDYWTLKESYIKAWGLGLAIPLRDFSFNVALHNDKHRSSHFNDSIISHQMKINSNISLTFAEHRLDEPTVWRSWLFYPSDEHRIALSLRSQSDNQSTEYQFRFFNSVPLMYCVEII